METSKKQNSRQQYASDYKEEIIRMLNSGKKSTRTFEDIWNWRKCSLQLESDRRSE